MYCGDDMKIGIQTAGVLEAKSVETDIAMLKKIGIETVELELNKEHLSKNYYQSLKNALELQRITISQVHMPALPEVSLGGEGTEKMLHIMQECIELCSWLGCPYFIVHPFSVARNYTDRRIGKEQEKNINQDFFKSLISFAKKYQVMICLTNELDNVNGHLCMGCCSTVQEVKEYIDTLNAIAGEECFGFCLHMGRALLLSTDIREMLLMLNNRVKTVQLCENDGIRDMAMPPFTSYTVAGQKYWDGLIRGLQKIGYEGDLIVTVRGFIGGIPSTLKWDTIQWLQKILSHIREKVDFVNVLQSDKKLYLFGSGNGFDNFMKYYGNVCEPVAILDNNQAKWGTRKNGLEICSPQILLQENLERIQIVICNIFFLEIEEQLRKMGIENICRYEELQAF